MIQYIEDNNVLFDESFFEVGDNLAFEINEFAFDKCFGCVVGWVAHIFKQTFEDIDL